eukprot:GEMP01081892.1.p1 GENE.GEMP01081892.1~~GEMP01081892.1.p1  ORF type:complete len:121 (-),score=2.96 GEMP01081892.1:384-746(-)
MYCALNACASRTKKYYWECDKTRENVSERGTVLWKYANKITHTQKKYPKEREYVQNIITPLKTNKAQKIHKTKIDKKTTKTSRSLLGYTTKNLQASAKCTVIYGEKISTDPPNRGGNQTA